MPVVLFDDLGMIDYQKAWDYQEQLLKTNVDIKTQLRNDATLSNKLSTKHYFFLCEHPPVYTLGKSGDIKNVLLSEQQLAAQKIQFFKTNRGGDITFHGPQQIVGYPILDLEHFYTDIGRYLRNLEEVIILTIAAFGIKGERSAGETGVWIDPDKKGYERKICAIGVRCSRWVTMHGFALNVNTDLNYFNHIIPCGIVNKQVTSIEKEVGAKVDMDEVKAAIQRNFKKVFEVDLVTTS
ncbi:lipoyl(octanoyl) transferase LipB [Ferruginibacter yonginensis]|uniref:Octanoyltransferase n=1 Tax=Ferruginibacter yonginensis TaxID=1310416 RepID=A0ABV8QQ88_9BACT